MDGFTLRMPITSDVCSQPLDFIWVIRHRPLLSHQTPFYCSLKSIKIHWNTHYPTEFCYKFPIYSAIYLPKANTNGNIRMNSFIFSHTVWHQFNSFYFLFYFGFLKKKVIYPLEKFHLIWFHLQNKPLYYLKLNSKKERE